MATEISPEQQQALDAQAGMPLRVVDPQTKKECVLLVAEFYDRLMATVDFGEPTESEKKALLQQWGKRAGWEDPEASVFDDLTPRP